MTGLFNDAYMIFFLIFFTKAFQMSIHNVCFFSKEVDKSTRIVI